MQRSSERTFGMASKRFGWLGLVLMCSFLEVSVGFFNDHPDPGWTAPKNDSFLRPLKSNEEEWLNTNEVGQQRSSRQKRAVGTSLDDASFSLVEVAHQAIADGQADYGDSYTFQMLIDLPSINAADKTDMRIEIFALEPTTNGIAAFHICQPHKVDFEGENLSIDSVYPVYTDVVVDGKTSITEKAIIDLVGVDTGGYGAPDNKTLIVVQFMALMVDYNVVNGQEYFISAGVEFGDSTYVWVGQAKVTANLQGQSYNAAADLLSLDGSPPVTTIDKGDGAVFQVQAYITNPSAEVEFEIFQPLGFNDIFHIGHVSHELGNAFACSRDELWTKEYTTSPSGLTTNRAVVKYPFLMNRDGTRDVTHDMNLVTFTFPIHVLNIETVKEGLVRQIAIGLKIGDVKLWTALHEITIGPDVTAAASVAPTFVPGSVKLINKVDTPVQGDGIIFQFQMRLPTGDAWYGFDTVIDGSNADIIPAGINIVDQGHVSFFPRPFTVRQVDGANLNYNFGDVHHVGINETLVTMEISVGTAIDIVPGNYTVPATVGGVSIPGLEFPIAANPAPLSVQVMADEFGFDDTWYQNGQAALDLKVTVPASAGHEELFFEAIPDFDVTAYSVRICRVQIYKIQDGLPCLVHSTTAQNPQYSKAADASLWNDNGEIDIGRTCPAQYPDEDDAHNTFVANYVFELPPEQAGITAGTFTLNGGLRLNNETIWVASRDYTVDTAVPLPYAFAGNNTPPYMAAYPFVSTMDRPNKDAELDIGEAFFVKYIIKPAALTRGEMYFTVAPPDANVRVCRVLLTHVGDNFPCTKFPDATISPHDTTTLSYGTVGNEHVCGETTTVTFKGLTNWGRTEVVTDLVPDEDSIQLVVFYQVCPGATAQAAPYPIPYEIGYTGGTPLTATYSEISLSGSAFTPPPPLVSAILYTSLTGPDETFYTTAPKLMQFKIKITSGYIGNFAFRLTNKDFGTDVHVDFCALELTKSGENLPCLIPDNVMTDVHNETEKLYNDEMVYEGITIYFRDVCHVIYSSRPEDDYITVEAAVRVKADSGTVNLHAAVHPITDVNTSPPTIDVATEYAFGDYALTIQAPADGDIPVTPLVLGQPKVMNAEGFATASPEVVFDEGPGQKKWIHFTIELPPETTVPMEVSVLLPSDGRRAILHATDIKFHSNCYNESMDCGVNVVCVKPQIDLRRTYPSYFERTANLTTFMQVDSVTVDLGYVTNAGFTRKRGLHTPHDDQFSVQVEVQMADHELSVHGSTFEVYFGVKFGDIIVVTSQTVKMMRDLADRITNERGNIEINFNQTYEASTPYNATDTLNIESLIYHIYEDPLSTPPLRSKAEGKPARIRVLLPQYTLYVNGSNDFSTNYTLPANSPYSDNPVTVEWGAEGTYIDFVFAEGILFSDLIELNFTLSIDPEYDRPVGVGEEEHAVVMTPVCEQTVFSGYPTAAGDLTSCGEMFDEPFTTYSGECYDPINVTDADCQITASSTYVNDFFGPKFAVSNGGWLWAPAIRTGEGWDEYLQFDFLSTVRINLVKFGTVSAVHQAVSAATLVSNVRGVRRVQVQVSNNPDNFVTIYNGGVKSGGTDADGALNMADFPPVEARYARLVIKEAGQTSLAATMPIGVNRVTWFGCKKKGVIEASCVNPNTTIDSGDNQLYRHFAVDHAHGIIYFCDRNPYRDGMFCYSSNQASGGNTWNELPRYVTAIRGYSETTTRMYFTDQRGEAALSSLDGKRIELTNPDDVAALTLIEPLNVPGRQFTYLSSNNVVWNTLYNGKKISADFDGIKLDDTYLTQWTTCCASSDTS